MLCHCFLVYRDFWLTRVFRRILTLWQYRYVHLYCVPVFDLDVFCHFFSSGYRDRGHHCDELSGETDQPHVSNQSNDSAAFFTQFICLGHLVFCHDAGPKHCDHISDDASDINSPHSNCTDGTSSIGTICGGESIPEVQMGRGDWGMTSRCGPFSPSYRKAV